MKKLMTLLLPLALVACAQAAAEPKGPQSYPATTTERLAISGLEAQFRELDAAGKKLVEDARARLGCPVVWDAKSGAWLLPGEAAPITSAR